MGLTNLDQASTESLLDTAREIVEQAASRSSIFDPDEEEEILKFDQTGTKLSVDWFLYPGYFRRVY